MYVVAPLAVAAVSAIGGAVTQESLATWYATLALPVWTPSGAVIGGVWTTLFVLTAVSIILAWSAAHSTQTRRAIAAVFTANLVLNLTWSLLFFGLHDIFAALLCAVSLAVSVVAAMIVVWPSSRVATLMLAPYAAWACFAGYLNYVIWTLN